MRGHVLFLERKVRHRHRHRQRQAKTRQRLTEKEERGDKMSSSCGSNALEPTSGSCSNVDRVVLIHPHPPPPTPPPPTPQTHRPQRFTNRPQRFTHRPQRFTHKPQRFTQTTTVTHRPQRFTNRPQQTHGRHTDANRQTDGDKDTHRQGHETQIRTLSVGMGGLNGV